MENDLLNSDAVSISVLPAQAFFMAKLGLSRAMPPKMVVAFLMTVINLDG